MRIPRVASVFAATVLAGSVLTAPAKADDFYLDDSFTVERVAVNHTNVAVNGLWTAPVTITLTTRMRPGERQTPGSGDGYVTLAEDRYPDHHQLYVPLKRVASSGELTTWQGVARLTGPSRSLEFTSVHNCLITKDGSRCPSFLYPQWLPKPVTVSVHATNTPVVKMDQRAPVELYHRAYRVSGRVLTTSGRPHARVRLVVGRGRECDRPGQGVATRTDTRGRFSLLVTNRPRAAIGFGKPLTGEHCIRVTSSARDSANRPVDLATIFTEHPWTTPIHLNAPTRVTRGKAATLWTQPTLLNPGTGLQFERLVGRTWHQVHWGTVAANGRGEVTLFPEKLGKSIYRVRVHGTNVTSPNYVITATP